MLEGDTSREKKLLAELLRQMEGFREKDGPTDPELARILTEIAREAALVRSYIEVLKGNVPKARRIALGHR